MCNVVMVLIFNISVFHLDILIIYSVYLGKYWRNHQKITGEKILTIVLIGY